MVVIFFWLCVVNTNQSKHGLFRRFSVTIYRSCLYKYCFFFWGVRMPRRWTNDPSVTTVRGLVSTTVRYCMFVRIMTVGWRRKAYTFLRVSGKRKKKEEKSQMFLYYSLLYFVIRCSLYLVLKMLIYSNCLILVGISFQTTDKLYSRADFPISLLTEGVCRLSWAWDLVL